MSIFGNIRHGFEQIPQGFQHLPDHLQHIPDELKKAGVDLGELQQWVHHECVTVLETAAEEFAKRALREGAEAATKLYNALSNLRSKRPDLADAIDEVPFYLGLSAVTLNYDRFYSRAEGLCKILNNLKESFEFRRSNIKTVALNTGPTSVSFDVSAELFSSLISIKAGTQIPLALGVELMDLVLAEVGVPE